jgi:hypothetical protein
MKTSELEEIRTEYLHDERRLVETGGRHGGGDPLLGELLSHIDALSRKGSTVTQERLDEIEAENKALAEVHESDPVVKKLLKHIKIMVKANLRTTSDPGEA